MLLVLLSLLAHAGEPTTVTWDLSLNGKVMGQRTLSVRTDETRTGELRTLQTTTTLDATVLGQTIKVGQKITANADVGPASFIVVTDQQGQISQIQGRRAAMGWIVTVASDGRTSAMDLPAQDVDLSTADLFDPRTTVPLARFQTVNILSAETGEVWSGPVEPLGPSTVAIDGVDVPVEGWAVNADGHKATFHYTSDGWLVKFESRLMGQRVQGVLQDPPPRGADDVPVDVFGPPLQAAEL